MPRKVAGVDLLAAESDFHQPCYSKFYSKYQTWKGYYRSSNAGKNVDLEILAANAIPFESMKSFIQNEIITNHGVMFLSVPCDLYIPQPEQENYPNPHFCSEKLIKKIEKDESISQWISFSNMLLQDYVSFWLVFSFSQAVAGSYLETSEDKLKDVAIFIKEIVLKAFKSSKEMPWHPIAGDIEKMLTEKLPEELERILNLTFSGTEPSNKTCE